MFEIVGMATVVNVEWQTAMSDQGYISISCLVGICTKNNSIWPMPTSDEVGTSMADGTYHEYSCIP